jgi:excisionase family DNA binding protein
MKDSPLNDVQNLRERLRLRIDAMAKAVAEVMQDAADLYLATRSLETEDDRRAWKVETGSAPEMMVAQEAAEYLGVKASTLATWRCTRRHPLPFVKVGKKVRYRKSDLDKFLQHRTKGGGDKDNSR